MASVLSESVIYSKSSQEITSLLYEACIINIEQAIEGIETNNFGLANKKLQKANDIIYRLGAGINYEAGIIADQLDALYNYLADQLFEANFKKDTSKLKHVLEMLERIAGAWNEAMNNKSKVQDQNYKNRSLAYEQNSFSHSNEQEINMGK